MSVLDIVQKDSLLTIGRNRILSHVRRDIRGARRASFQLAIRRHLESLPDLGKIIRRAKILFPSEHMHALVDMSSEVTDLFSRVLAAAADNALRLAVEDIVATAPQSLLLASGVPLSPTRRIIPAPGVHKTRKRAKGLAGALETCAQLIYPLGDDVTGIDPVKWVLSRMNADQTGIVESWDQSVSRPWWEKTGIIHPRIQQMLANSIVVHPSEVLGEVEEAFAKHARRVELELRHEILRVRGEADKIVMRWFGILEFEYAGFGDSEHRSLDGESREIAAVPLPPMRKNCTCYTIPVWPEVDEVVFETPFQEQIGVRDMRVFAQWFDDQNLSVQADVVGDRRMIAAQLAHDEGPITLASFYSREGKLMDRRALSAEDAIDRQYRVMAVAASWPEIDWSGLEASPEQEERSLKLVSDLLV